MNREIKRQVIARLLRAGRLELANRVAAADGYQMGHRPSTGAPVYDLTQIAPDDVYTHPRYYADMSQRSYQESFSVILSVRNKPKGFIHVYRAAPVKQLNTGDWISLSKTYAKQESMRENTKVYSFLVKRRDVWWPGDDFNEFGYFGPPTKR